MKRMTCAMLAAVLLAALAMDLSAQRRKTEKQEGEAATVVYRQDFENDGDLDNFASDSGTVKWNPEGAFGSSGCLKLTGDHAVSAEKYMKWEDKDTTVAFMFYAHGVKNAYAMARGEKAGKNLKANFPKVEQDKWIPARMSAASFVGFKGGGGTPGENFRNILFVMDEVDKNVADPYLLIDNIVIFNGADGKKPTAAASNITAEANDKGGCSLNWDQAKDDVAINRYLVHRSETKGFTPSAQTCIADIADNYYEDKTAAPGKAYYYRIEAKDLGGFPIISEEIVYGAPAAGTKTGDKPAEF